MDFLYDLLVDRLLAVIAVLGGALVTYLQRRRKKLEPYVFGLVAAAAIVALGTSWKVYRSQQPRVTTANVERYVRDWSDAFKYTITRIENKDAEFMFTVFVPNNKTPIHIIKPKDGRFLSVAANLELNG